MRTKQCPGPGGSSPLLILSVSEPLPVPTWMPSRAPLTEQAWLQGPPSVLATACHWLITWGLNWLHFLSWQMAFFPRRVANRGGRAHIDEQSPVAVSEAWPRASPARHPHRKPFPGSASGSPPTETSDVTSGKHTGCRAPRLSFDLPARDLSPHTNTFLVLHAKRVHGEKHCKQAGVGLL